MRRGLLLLFNPQTAALLRTKVRSGLVGLVASLRSKWLEILVSSAIILSLVIGGYRLFLTGARFFLHQGEIGDILVDRLFYLGWSIIFYLLILSNIVTAFSTLYRSPEVNFLLTVPLSYLRVFRLKLIENVVYSSWAILILGLPLTLAYGDVRGLTGWEQLLVFLLGLLPYLLLATISGVLILLGVIWFSRWFRMRSVFFALGVIFVGVFYLYFNINQRGTVLSAEMGNFRALGRYMFNLGQTPFPLIPSYWLKELFTRLALGDWGGLVYFATLFLTTAMVGWELAGWFAGRFYFQSYQIMEGSEHRGHVRESGRWFRIRWFGFDAPMRALISKDVVQFIRTPQQWIQFLLLSFFIAVYLINLSRGRIHFHDLPDFWQNFIYIFNFGFSGFILSALVARFVFPLISMEGQGRWILLASPLSLSRIFREKFWLSIIPLFLLTEIVALVSNYFLQQSVQVAVMATIFLMLTSLALISLALGLGAVYAQFHESNPMKISSGYGGIITVVLSLIYVGISVFALISLIRILEDDTQSPLIPVIISGILVLTILYTWLPLRWGYRALANQEG